MKRAGAWGVGLAAGLALVGLAAEARAETSASGLPLLGGQFSVTGGAAFAASQREVDAALGRAGRPELPAVVPGFQVRFGLMAYDVTLDLHIGGSDVGLAEPDGGAASLELSRVAIGADLGYRLRFGGRFSLMPFVGIGTLKSTLCFAGHPDPSSATARPLFEQIAKNPGREACLEASDVGLDAGLALAWNLRLFPAKTATSSLAGYLSIGPRAGYTLPLSGSRTWSASPSSGLQTPIPPFAGPLAPLGGVYVGIEAQIRFETE